MTLIIDSIKLIFITELIIFIHLIIIYKFSHLSFWILFITLHVCWWATMLFIVSDSICDKGGLFF